MVSDLVFVLVVCGVGLVDVVYTNPLLPTLVKLDENRIVRVGHPDAAFTLVDDRLQRLEGGLSVNDHRHLLVEELCPRELLVPVAREQIGIVFGDCEDPCNAKAKSAAVVDLTTVCAHHSEAPCKIRRCFGSWARFQRRALLLPQAPEGACRGLQSANIYICESTPKTFRTGSMLAFKKHSRFFLSAGRNSMSILSKRI